MCTLLLERSDIIFAGYLESPRVYILKYRFSNCHLMDDWMKKMCYIKKTDQYTMEYYPAAREDEILPFVTTWLDPESIMRREVSRMKRTMWFHSYVRYKTESNKQRDTTKSQIQTTELWLPEGTAVGERINGVEYEVMEGGRLDWVVSTQWNIQMVYYWIVHVKFL